MDVVYLRLRIIIFLAKISHLFSNNLESHDHVGKDDLADLFTLIEVKAFGVDDTHLLQNGGLPRFSGACRDYSQQLQNMRCQFALTQSDSPRSRIFTRLESAFLSLRISLSISAFFFLSSLVSRVRELPPAAFGKHILKTMGESRLSIAKD